MILKDVLLEDIDYSEVYKDFNNTLTLVFSKEYLKKIQSVLTKSILIKEKDFKSPDKASYVVGRTIYINKPIFERLSSAQKTKYLLHEYIHVIQNTKNFFVLRAFKEVFELGKSLYKIMRKNLEGSVSEFLVGFKSKIGDPKIEVISYLMNGDIDWTKMSKNGKIEFIEALNNSGMFNLKSSFWKERLL